MLSSAEAVISFGPMRNYFLLAFIELFTLDVTAEALRAIIGSKSAILLQQRPVLTQNFR